MSDIPIDNAVENAATSTPVAPPQGAGDPPGSAPASVDATASEPAKEEAPKPDQSRSESRRQANQRRENRELQREIGRMQAQMEALRQAANPQQEQEQVSPAQAAAERRQIALARNAMERLEDAGDDIEGFDDVLKKVTSRDFPMTGAMVEFLGDTEHPAQVAKWLSEHPREAERISLMSDWRADRALEKVAAELKATPAPRTTNTPPPPPTVNGRGTPQISLESASMEDFVKMRNEQRAKAGYK